MNASIVGFNYEALDETQRAKARDNAGKIHKVLRRTTSAIVEIGRHLIEVHDALGRQYFQAWLKAEFRWNQATASTYETVARKFGDLTCLDQFNPSALYTLSRAAIDPRVVKEAVKRAERGEIITRMEVAKIIRKFLLKPAAGAVANVITAPATKSASVPGVLNATFTDLRSFLRRLDVTTIPNDQRVTLADELLELAKQLRSGCLADGAPVATSPATGPVAASADAGSSPSPRQPSPAPRRRGASRTPEATKCA